MTEYLITILGDEDVWEARAREDEGQVEGAHREFARALTDRGHRVRAGGELSSKAEARVVRRTASGYAVTDGPYADSREQVGGFYLVETDDVDDLLAIVGALAQTEPVVEVRPLLGRTEGA